MDKDTELQGKLLQAKFWQTRAVVIAAKKKFKAKRAFVIHVMYATIELDEYRTAYEAHEKANKELFDWEYENG